MKTLFFFLIFTLSLTLLSFAQFDVRTATVNPQPAPEVIPRSGASATALQAPICDSFTVSYEGRGRDVINYRLSWVTSRGATSATIRDNNGNTVADITNSLSQGSITDAVPDLTGLRVSSYRFTARNAAGDCSRTESVPSISSSPAGISAPPASGIQPIAIGQILPVTPSVAISINPQPFTWITAAGFMIMISLILLVLVYMAGYGFQINELKFLSQEELYQLIVTAVIIASIAGMEAALNSFSASVGIGSSLQGAALAHLQKTSEIHETMTNNIRDFSIKAGEESSKSRYCSLHSVGFSLASCGSFRFLTFPSSIAFQMLSVSGAELESLRTLVNFGFTRGLSLILPFGLLLRTFKITRGAGGLFIGLGVALYLLLPLSVIFVREITDAFKKSDRKYETISPLIPNLNSIKCDQDDSSQKNYDSAIRIFDALRKNLGGYVYFFLAESTLPLVISLFTMITGIRFISRLTGSEVDISALARLA